MGMFEVESWAANKNADKLSKQLFSENKKKRNLDENKDTHDSSRKQIKVDKTEKSNKRKHINLEEDHELNSAKKQQKSSKRKSKELDNNISKIENNPMSVDKKKNLTKHSKMKIDGKPKAKSPRNKYKHLALKKTELKEGENSVIVGKTEDCGEIPVEKSKNRREKGVKNKGKEQPRESSSTVSPETIKKGQTSSVEKHPMPDKNTKIPSTTSPVKENKRKRKRKKKNNPKKNKYRHLIEKDTSGEEDESLKVLETDKRELSDVKKKKLAKKQKLAVSGEPKRKFDGDDSANKEGTKPVKRSKTDKSEPKRKFDGKDSVESESAKPTKKSKTDKSEPKRKFGDDDSVETNIKPTKRTKTECSLKERMNVKLNAARFRYLNEKLYTQTGVQSLSLFKDDEEAFQVYHDGFQSQVLKWPSHPLDTIIKYISTRSPSLTVADFGCGDAKLAQTVPNKVHSFDFVALNKFVTPCNMSKVPIADQSVDVAVFCLSLMGTNLVDYLKEANRVLKTGGILKVAEVCSRFQSLQSFIEQLKTLGFALLHQNTSNKMFVLLDFKKTSKPKGAIPQFSLMPCVYKKR